MGTGYTNPVAEGEIQDFKIFALRCARAISYLIDLRDEPAGAPIPDRLKPSTFYAEQAERLREELAVVEKMDREQVKALCAARYEMAVRDRKARQEKRAVVRSRYDRMLLKVEAYEPPSKEHQSLKDFMRDQLESSIRHDCGEILSHAPVKEDPDEWLESRKQQLRQSIEDAEGNQLEEYERTEERNEWLRLLRESLEKLVAAEAQTESN